MAEAGMSPETSFPWKFVMTKDARQLPLHLRVGWCAAIAERVIRLFSPHYQEKYRQRAAVEISWAFALGRDYSLEEISTVSKAIDDLEEEAESEGYGLQLISLGTSLLGEIQTKDGRGSVSAIDMASLGFARSLVWRQGVGEAYVPDEYVDKLASKVYACAWQTFLLAKAHGSSPITRTMFDSIPLTLSYEPIPPELLKEAAQDKPPDAEVAFLSQS
jgi:hypothetical protein